LIARDGSWIIPMSQFKLRLEHNFSKENSFCAAASSECAILPFVLYQMTGIEYKLINP